MNLVDILKDLAGPAITKQAASRLGESEDGVNNALGAAIPAVLGGLLSKTGDATALGGILDMFKGMASGNGIGDGQGDGFGDGQGNGFGDGQGNANASKGVLESILGSGLGNVLDLVGKAGGIKAGSAGGIMTLVVNLVGKFFGGKVQTEGLNTAGFATLLMDQKSHILSALPAGAGALIGLSDLPKIDMPSVDVPKVEVSKPNLPDLDVSKGGGTNWLVPALGAALVAGLIWWFTRPMPQPTINVGNAAIEHADDNVREGTDSLEQGSDHASDSVKDAAGAAQDAIVKALPDGQEIKFHPASIEAELVGFVEDKDKPLDETSWFNFHGLNFDTGKASLMAGTYDEITNLAAIMKAYPNVHLKIGGYTDNTGDPAANVTLSQQRAETVLAALVGAGVEKSRLEAEGYGADHPVATNDTEEGRAQNRRIAVRVTAK